MFSRQGLKVWLIGLTVVGLPIDAKTIFNHITFIGDYKKGTINFVIWTLDENIYFFPLLMILVIKFNWKNNRYIKLHLLMEVVTKCKLYTY